MYVLLSTLLTLFLNEYVNFGSFFLSSWCRFTTKVQHDQCRFVSLPFWLSTESVISLFHEPSLKTVMDVLKGICIQLSFLQQPLKHVHLL